MTVYQVKIETKVKAMNSNLVETYLFSTLVKASTFAMHNSQINKIKLENLSSKESGTHYFGTGFNKKEEFTCVYITSEKVD